MARLLEIKNDPLGIGISVDNGALINYTALHKKNGILTGCTLSNQNGQLWIDKGTLSIQGFRIQFEEPEMILDLSNFQTSSTGLFQVVIRINYDAIENTAEYEIVPILYSTENVLNSVQIQEKISGSFEFPIANFKKNGNEITEFKSLINTIEIDESELEYQTIEI